MKLTWFGHSAFRVEFGDCRVMIDPFLTGNPSFTGDPKAAADGATHVLLTHGHNDHVGDAAEICKANGAMLCRACGGRRLHADAGRGEDQFRQPQRHGRLRRVHRLVRERAPFLELQHGPNGEIIYLGNPLGLIVKAPGEPTLYHMGDTGIFGDMALINEIHQPEIGIVPIGDRFTMGGKIAALACKRYFKFRTIIPCHYGDFSDPRPDGRQVHRRDGRGRRQGAGAGEGEGGGALAGPRAQFGSIFGPVAVGAGDRAGLVLEEHLLRGGGVVEIEPPVDDLPIVGSIGIFWPKLMPVAQKPP